MRDGGLAERPSENVIRVKYLRGNLDFQPIKRTVDLVHYTTVQKV